jgi:hypothetical protein
MNTPLKSLAFRRALSGLLIAICFSSVVGQEPVPTRPAEGRVPDSRIALELDPVPSGPQEKLPEKMSGQLFSRRLEPVSLTVMQGVRVWVDNRSTGPIIVHGWDRDVIEARATSERGEELIIFGQSDDDGPKRFSFKADYVNAGSLEPPTKVLELPPLNNEGPIPIRLEVNVPRYAEIELIRVIRSNVEVTSIDTAVAVVGHSSNMTLKDVSSVEAHTRTGAIVIENARGITDVSSSTGKISVANSRGAVRAVSIAGPIEISCVKGRVDVGNTQAPIDLKGIDGDVEAIASSSDVRFMGPLSDDARYYLKSMSGRVEMIIPADTHGFNATLTSYRGSVESDFSLASKPATQDPGDKKHRLAGRFGKGSSQITLDSFEGLVKLTKVPRGSLEACK